MAKKPNPVDIAIVVMLENISKNVNNPTSDFTVLYEYMTEFMNVLFTVEEDKQLPDPYGNIINYIQYIPDLENLNNTEWFGNFKLIIDNYDNGRITQIGEFSRSDV